MVVIRRGAKVLNRCQEFKCNTYNSFSFCRSPTTLRLSQSFLNVCVQGNYCLLEEIFDRWIFLKVTFILSLYPKDLKLEIVLVVKDGCFVNFEI